MCLPTPARDDRPPLLSPLLLTGATPLCPTYGTTKSTPSANRSEHDVLTVARYDRVGCGEDAPASSRMLAVTVERP